jgi:hypothetical protein
MERALFLVTGSLDLLRPGEVFWKRRSRVYVGISELRKIVYMQMFATTFSTFLPGRSAASGAANFTPQRAAIGSVTN